MKIIRDGKEFELTPEEVFAAYLEQQAIYDRENIVQNMEGYLSDHEYLVLKGNEAFIASAAAKLRQKEDDGLSYDSALTFAYDEAKAEFQAQIDAFIDPDAVDIGDARAAETWAYYLLGNAEIKNSRVLNVKSSAYFSAMDLVKDFLEREFPELYEVIFGAGDYLVFKDGEKFDYDLYYYNPDSSAGGQLVVCPFSEEQAERMLGNEYYGDVLAENTQYLADVNNVCFFDVVFNLCDMKKDGRFLGVSLNKVCKDIVEQQKEAQVKKESLADKISGAEKRTAESVSGPVRPSFER